MEELLVDQVDIGCTLNGKFFILNELGRGSYGRVFAAMDVSNNSRVAIKQCYGNSMSKALERGVNEARLLEFIQNVKPSHGRLVVGIKERFLFNNCLFIVLELLSHNLWEPILAEAFSSFSSMATLAKDMIEFLCSMSKIGIIHGDIKPDNILVDHACTGIKFADFGLSFGPPVDSKEAKIQTVVYRSPEVIMGYNYDESVDTWSTGCVLMTCFLRRFLFPAVSDLEMMQLIAKVIGTPSREVMENAPNRSLLFDYNMETNEWLIRGFDSHGSPMGLRRYLQVHHGRRDCSPAYLELIDLVEGMMKLNPQERYKPEKCLHHPFLMRSMDDWKGAKYRPEIAIPSYVFDDDDF